MPIQVIIAEDTFVDGQDIRLRIESEFAETDVQVMRTEREFRDRLDEIAAPPPALFILDVMLRWDHPGPAPTVRPPEVEEEGWRRAGIRLQELLAQRPSTAATPVILLSVLKAKELQHDIDRLPAHVHFLEKSESLDHLIELVRSILRPVVARR